MKRLFKFLIDELTFTIIYSLSLAFIIGFYSMTTKGAEILYPVLAGVFFYMVYMIVRGCQYFFNYRNIQKLRLNNVDVISKKNEYQESYAAILDVYKRYNDKLATVTRESNEDKRFISAFIHNLKTPVTVSSLIVQRAKKGEISGETALFGIEKEIKRLSQDMDMLLDIERLSEFKNDYEPKAVNLYSELTRIINEQKDFFINSHVYPKFDEEIPDNEKFENKIYDKEFTVYTDTKWNSMLISQVISNAIKYSRSENEKYVHFSIRKKDKRTELIIKDEGIGIPECDLPKVFDAFFTGENGRSGYNSSGIGLYLCKEICESLNHEIHIENDDGCKVTISYLSKM